MRAARPGGRSTPIWGSDAAALAALAALLALPGLAVVRAPWTAAPLLSLGFWSVSWWWMPGGRLRFLHAALLAFGLLAALRLLKPLGARRPSAPVSLVLAVALAWLSGWALGGAPPGDASSTHAAGALLLIWRDGIPATSEPLLPLAHFGAHAPALPGLAADLVLLSGAAVDRSLLLAGTAAQGLLAVSLFALLRRFFVPMVAAPAAALTQGAATWLHGPALLGRHETALALAFALGAAALLARGTTRAPAVAAGLMLAGVVLADVTLMPVLALAAPAYVLCTQSREGGVWRERVRRFVLCLTVAAAFAAPYAERAAPAWGGTELVAALTGGAAAPGLTDIAALAAAIGGLTLVLRSARGDALVAPATGAGLAIAGAALGSASLLAVAAVFGGGGVAFLLSARPRLRAGVLLVLVLAAAAGLASATRTLASDPLRPHERDALAWLRVNTRPLDIVCHDGSVAGWWIAALAGRAAEPTPVPAAYAVELSRQPPEPCAYELWTGRQGPTGDLAGRVAYRSGRVVVITRMSHSRSHSAIAR